MIDAYESFLYPSVYGSPSPLDESALTASVQAKTEELLDLRQATWDKSSDALVDAAWAISRRLRAGGVVLALGNGGSATDCEDFVADLLTAKVPALNLSANGSILTALGNDVGFENVFRRQIIAYARPADVVVSFSTSGNSKNVLGALQQAREQGLLVVAFVGYDGGDVRRSGLAQQLIWTPSTYVPRIQEAQATAYHALCKMIERCLT